MTHAIGTRCGWTGGDEHELFAQQLLDHALEHPLRAIACHGMLYAHSVRLVRFVDHAQLFEHALKHPPHARPERDARA